MRGLAIAVAALLTLCVAVGLSLPARGAGAIVHPNDMWVAGVFTDFTLEPVYSVSFTWSSDIPLSLSVSGNGGLIDSFGAATSGSGSCKTHGEDLFLTWYNSGSVNATLEYELTYVYQSEHAISSLLFAGIIIGVIVVAVVIVVVLYAVKALTRPGGLFQADRDAQIQTFGPMGPQKTPMETCPGCGSRVNPSTRICPGCGARVE